MKLLSLKEPKKNLNFLSKVIQVPTLRFGVALLINVVGVNSA
jgi:hypothetical protein